MINGMHETLIFAVYYAPRGRERLYRLGRDVAQRHLYPSDLLIGIIGDQGSGKSTLIRGLFPGVELTNDDDGINMPTSQLFSFDEDSLFNPHTYHIDVRFEQAFHQLYEMAEIVAEVLKRGHRVIVEHFDLLYPHLQINAQVLFGIGEELIVARPSVFGPHPEGMKAIAYRTVKFRKMAHSAEDITNQILHKQYGITFPHSHSDVKHGFVIAFNENPEIDIAKLEKDVQAVIAKDLPICTEDENHIRIGNDVIVCTGPRIHVSSTGQIEAFRLASKLNFDPIRKEYLLVGVVGEDQELTGYDNILKIIA